MVKKYKLLEIGIIILILIVFFFIFSTNFSCNPSKSKQDYKDLKKTVNPIDSTIIRLEREIDSLNKIPKSNDTQIIIQVKRDFNRIILNDDSISEFLRSNLSSQRDSE